MNMIRLFSVFIAIVIIFSLFFCEFSDSKKESSMNFKTVSINLLQGALVTLDGVKNISKEIPGYSWFYSISGLKADGFWEPKESDIRQAEQLVLSALTLHIHNPDNSPLRHGLFKGMDFPDEGIKEILDNYLSYNRQYVGVIFGEERFIYFNSFPKEDGENNFTWIEVEDGDAGYWQILVGIDRNECTCLSINGEA